MTVDRASVRSTISAVSLASATSGMLTTVTKVKVKLYKKIMHVHNNNLLTAHFWS